MLDYVMLNPPGLVFDGSAFTPASLPNLLAWFDPSYGVYSDAGTTPAVADDPVYRWVARNGASLYFDQSTLARRFILREGANGKKWIDGSAGTKWADWSQSLTLPLTIVVGMKSVKRGDFSAYMGPPDSANMAVRQFGNGNFILSQSADATGDITFPASDPESFGTYSLVWEAAAGTNRGREYGDADTTSASADLASAVNAWRLQGFFSDGASGFSKASFTHLIFASASLSDADRQLAEAFIDAEEPT